VTRASRFPDASMKSPIGRRLMEAREVLGG